MRHKNDQNSLTETIQKEQLNHESGRKRDSKNNACQGHTVKFDIYAVIELIKMLTSYAYRLNFHEIYEAINRSHNLMIYKIPEGSANSDEEYIHNLFQNVLEC